MNPTKMPSGVEQSNPAHLDPEQWGVNPTKMPSGVEQRSTGPGLRPRRIVNPTKMPSGVEQIIIRHWHIFMRS